MYRCLHLPLGSEKQRRMGWGKGLRGYQRDGESQGGGTDQAYCYLHRELKAVMEDYPFDYNVQGFNAVNSAYRIDGLRTAWESGAGTIAMNPLATGDILKYAHIFDAIRIRDKQSLAQAAYAYVLSVPWVHSALGTFNSEEQIDEAVAVLDETPYCSEELERADRCLKERIRSCPLRERIETGKALRQRPYILREEVAALMEVYPLSV